MEINYLPVDQENIFWLQIMVDNAQVIYNRLMTVDPKTKEAQEISGVFERLLGIARQKPSAEQAKQLMDEAYRATKRLREFILTVLREQVTKHFVIFVQPEYLNNMVSLTEKYLYILGEYLMDREPKVNAFINDIFWLPVFISETRLIADNVGNYEEEIRQRANEFTQHFARLVEFAFTLQGIFRIGITDFPIANQHRQNILKQLNSFAEFIVDIIQLVRENRLPGTLTDFALDSIYRKLCYYTTQLSVISNVSKPACDPAGPRLSTVG